MFFLNQTAREFRLQVLGTLKKLDLQGKTTPRYCIKKNLSRRLRKFLNPCPTHKKQYRIPCENDHDWGQAWGFF